MNTEHNTPPARDEDARGAAALHLWDAGIIRPESQAREVVDFLLREGHMAFSSPPADNVREALYRAMYTSEPTAGRVAGDLFVNRILSDPNLEVRPRWTVTTTSEPARILADPKAGCSCEPFDQDAGGGHTEHLLEYEPDCPEHSTHLYDPRAGEWILDPRGTVTTSVDEWRVQMDTERARQVEHGYDDAHDAKHGVAHLLNRAIDYARRGNNLAAATMVRCALRLPYGTVTHTEVGVPPLADDCDCEDREALVRPEGLVCGTCGKVIEAAREARS